MPPSLLFNGMSGSMPCSYSLLTAPGAYSMRLPFLPAGGMAPHVGRSTLSGDNSVPPSGTHLNFRHFGHHPLTTGSKKNPSSLRCLIPLLPLLAFNAKRALPYPFCFLHLSSALAKVPKSRLFHFLWKLYPPVGRRFFIVRSRRSSCSREMLGFARLTL